MSAQASLLRGEKEWDGDFYGSVSPVPDPIHVEDETGLVGTFVPGRWTDYQAIRPDEENDWRGFRAAPGVSAFLNEQFGTNPGTRILVSADEAERFTTEEKLLATQ